MAKTKETGSADLKQPIVLQQITVRPINRQSQDITKWRNATRSAEATVPRRVSLYDLYADITSTDAHIISVWGKRVDAVTSADWQFTDKDGKPVDEINELLDCIGFEDLLTAIIDSKAWGYSMVEPSFFVNDDGRHEFATYLVPRKHMRPDKGIITFEQTGDSGLNIREGIYAKTIMEVGKASDLGVLLSAAQYAIYKRGDLSDWAEFIEIFGRGIIDATWDGFDEGQRAKLSDSLHEMGGGGIIIRPEGTNIDIKGSTSNATGDLQEKFMSAMNKEISKALLGSTETTESSKSSGYAQAETHQQQDVKKNETDITFTRRILNSRFIKILKAAGFDTKGGSFTLKSEKSLSKKEAFEIHKAMAKDLGLPIDDDFFYEEYEMPKPKDYDAQKAEKEATRAEIANNPEPKNDDTPPPSGKGKGKKPAGTGKQEDGKPVTLSMADRSFLRRLTDFFQPAPAVTTGAEMKQMAESCCGSHLIKLSLPSNALDEDAVIKRFYAAGGSLSFDAGIFNYTAQTLLNGLKRGWNNKPVNLADIGFIYGMDDPTLLTAFEQNLFRFSSAKTLAEAQELNRLFRSAKSFDQFYMNAKLKLEVFNKTWLEAEYNTAYLTGESAATYYRLLAQVKTFPYWCYKTVGDDHVRMEHRALHDLILPANDPIWKKLFPPNGWNCRCYIVPRMEHEVKDVDFNEMRDRAAAYFSTDEYIKAKAQGWAVNRADSAEVFTANQFYIKKFPGKAAKLLDQLGPADFNLPSYSNAKKAAVADLPEFQGTPGDFYRSQEQANGKAMIRDYHNRPIELLPENSSNKQQLEAMKETIQKPDEVWLNGEGYETFTAIKYYKDQTLVVTTEIKDGKSHQVSSWFKLDEVKKIIEQIRRGLLIFSRS